MLDLQVEEELSVPTPSPVGGAVSDWSMVLGVRDMMVREGGGVRW